MLLAWLLDVILVTIALVSVVVSLFLHQDRSADVSNQDAAFAVIGALVALPALYGFCCFAGRSLGTLVAGTAWIADATQRRAGHWRMAWIMWSRLILAPVVLAASLLDFFDDADAHHSQVKVRGTGW